jgi:transcriptional regulator with XRE-family HTH domain
VAFLATLTRLTSRTPEGLSDMGSDTSEGDARTDMLGAYIRAQRRLADLSLRQLSAQSNVSNAYLSQIERGLHQPSVSVLRAIAEALNLSAETLLAQAGLFDPSESKRASRRDVEAAIDADPDLTPENKRVLLGVYRSLKRNNERPGTGTPEKGEDTA